MTETKAEKRQNGSNWAKPGKRKKSLGEGRRWAEKKNKKEYPNEKMWKKNQNRKEGIKKGLMKKKVMKGKK